MKKIIAALLVISTLFTVGCGKTQKSSKKDSVSVSAEPTIRVELTDEQIVEAVAEITAEHFGKEADTAYINSAKYGINTAKNLENFQLGAIADEKDLTDRVGKVFGEKYGEDYVERVESDYTEVGGKKQKFTRDNPPYTCRYYEQYDFWYVTPNAPTGTLKNGKRVEMYWNNLPFLVVRGGDGLVVSCNT